MVNDFKFHKVSKIIKFCWAKNVEKFFQSFFFWRVKVVKNKQHWEVKVEGEGLGNRFGVEEWEPHLRSAKQVMNFTKLHLLTFIAPMANNFVFTSGRSNSSYSTFSTSWGGAWVQLRCRCLSSSLVFSLQQWFARFQARAFKRERQQKRREK